MYSIYVDGKLLYSPVLAESGYLVFSPKLTLELGKSGSFTFLLPPSNPLYDGILKLKSIVTVYDGGEEIFRGRVLHDEKDFYNRKEVYCEGELAFLLDSVQRPYEFKGDIPDIFAHFIESHNAQVDADKRFIVGEVTVTDPNNYIHRSNIHYSNTWDEISGQLISTHGGYLRPRLSDGKRYIDFVDNYGKVNSQVIEFGKNILDISEYITAENVFTVLIPLGIDLTDEEGNSLGRLTIESVNDGKDYIEDDAGIALFGRIVRTFEWDDVTNAENLFNKGRALLDASIEMAVTLTMNAVDLHIVNVDTERIGLGDYVRVISAPHNLNRYFVCAKIVLDLVNPENSEYTLGVTYTTMTEQQVEGTKVIQSTVTSAQSATKAANQAAQTVQNVVANMDGAYVPTRVYREDMTQKGLFKLLTNNGTVQGMVFDEVTGDVYVNASYIKSGTLTIGGIKDDSSKLEILDSSGEVCVEAGPNGIKVLKGEINATSGSLESVTIVDGITISTKDEAVKDLSLVRVTKSEGGAGTVYSITIGESTSRSTPLELQGSSIAIRGASSLTFSADNIIFENTIEAPTAYFDDVHVGNAIHFDLDDSEKQIHFKTQTTSGTYQHNSKLYGGNAASKVAFAAYDYVNGLRIFAYDDVSKQFVSDITKWFLGNTTDEQKNIHICSTDDATNVHKCKIYGGEGESTTGIGIYDVKNNREIWVYDDVDNIVRSNARLDSGTLEVTIDEGATDVTSQSIYYPFLRSACIHARFISTAIPANTAVTLGTISKDYAPKGFAAAMAVYNPSSVCSVYLTSDGLLKIKSTNAIPEGTKLYVDGSWIY